MHQELLQKKTAKLNRVHRVKKRTHRAAVIVALGIVIGTVSALVLPAVTMNREVICPLEEHTHTDTCYTVSETPFCGMEESGEHVHTDACYKTLCCGRDEHVHTDLCYRETSDDTADVETAEIWELSMAFVGRTGDWSEDVPAIARTQLGYRESTENFRYTEAGSKNGYTRYGAWRGDPYGAWNAAFASFCLHYAGVPEDVIPSASDVSAWTEELTARGRFATNAFTPRQGDLVFLADDASTRRVGIVVAAEENGFMAIEGDRPDGVVCNEYAYNDPAVYGYGCVTGTQNETRLRYADDRIAAVLTVQPRLPDGAELLIENVSPTEDTALWKRMAAPVAEIAEDELRALDLYRFRVLVNGEEFAPDTYELTLQARAKRPAAADNIPAKDEVVRTYVLSAAAGEVPETAPDTTGEIDPIAYALSALLPEGAADTEDESGKDPLPEIRAEYLSGPSDAEGDVRFTYSGTGGVYGFAAASLPKAAAPIRKSFGVLKADPVIPLPHSKTIDYLGDGKNNPDTTLDTTAADNSNLYRLYLDMGPLESKQPLDLLIIIDQSGSMRANSDVKVNGRNMRRDQAVTYLLNGSTTESTADGIISRFLAMNSENMVAVARFGGDPNRKDGSNDHRILQTWTDTPVFVSADTTTNIGTNYNAGLKEGHDLLEDSTVKSNTHKKVVVFISDGVPTFASEVSDSWSLGTRQGDGSESNSANGGKYAAKVETLTLNAIHQFQAAHPAATVSTIGIGNFQTRILSEMNFNGGKTYQSSDYNALLSAMQEIIAASADKYTDLVIRDELSEYVQFIDNKWEASDLVVQSVTPDGIKTTLYENGAVTAAGKTYLTDHAVSVDGKKITVTFKPEMELSLGLGFRLSYNVEVTQAAFTKYAADKKTYPHTGDAATDFAVTENNTSSEKPGYHTNQAASVSFKRNGTAGSVNYDHPVAQVKEKPAPTPVNMTAPKLPISKQIDYLGDNSDNPDTTLDNTLLGGNDNLKELYRLYLSAGPVGQMEPMDMLVVVDQSTSMNTKDMDGGRRDDAVTKILNGSQNAVTSDGLISRFLSMNPKNKLAVISFFGNVAGSYSGDPVTLPVSADTATLLGWTNAAEWAGKGVVDCTCKTRSGTDYSAAYVKMDEMLRSAAVATDGHEKIVVFLSDGVPTFYLENGTATGKYTRRGNGSDSNAEQTPAAFDRYFGAMAESVSVYSIGIGNFDKTVLDYMSEESGGQTYTARDYASLLNALKEVMTGKMKTFRNLTIHDKLSPYVDLYADQPEFKVTVTTMDGNEIVLYRNNDPAMAGFTEDASSVHFTEEGKKYLKTFSWDADDKTVTAVFCSGTDLILGSAYTVSFNGKVTAAAYAKKTYDAVGDPGTDYADNVTSSGRNGFYSNDSANHASSAEFTYQSVNYVEDYERPVVQIYVEEPIPPHPVQVAIRQNKTIDALRDGAGNGDTDADTNPADAAYLNDLYRLYLDAGEMMVREPVDMLIIIDRSGSMQNAVGGTGSQRKDNAVSQILNGTRTDRKDGLIYKFLKMNPDNQVAVIDFAGDWVNNYSRNTKQDPYYNFDISTDSHLQLEWSGLTDWTARGSGINCTAKDSNGTNYSAAFIHADTMLQKDAVKNNGHKKMVAFLSDGMPTFYVKTETSDPRKGTLTRVGNGQEPGDGGNDNVEGNKAANSQNAFMNYFGNKYGKTVPVYAIGIGMTNAKTAVMEYMANQTGGTLTRTANYDQLLKSIEDIIYGGTGAFRALSLTDTLSEYVDLYQSNADMIVSLKNDGEETTIYQRNAAAGSFTDTGKNAANTTFNTSYLKSVSFDGKKTVTVTFKESVELDRTALYQLSFNVKATQTAYDTFKSNERSGLDGYGGVMGDLETDYAANTTSSEEGGFYSNESATASYYLGDTPFALPYEHPVVQVDTHEMQNTLDIIVSKRWGADVTDETLASVSSVQVKLYQGIGTSTALTPVLNGENAPVVLTLEKSGDWSCKVDGLPQKDASGKEIRYYIQEVTNTSNDFPFHPVYSQPVGGVSIKEGSNTRTGQTVGYVGDMTERSEYETVGNAWVRNDLLVELPETGGGGTAWFTLTGFLLMIAAMGKLYAKKRKTEKNRKKYSTGGQCMKKLFTLLLTVVMVLACGVNTFAAEDTGKITVQNATIGQTYKAYRVFPATVYDKNASADQFAISYTYNGAKWKTNDYFTKDAAGYIRATEQAIDEATGHLTPGAITFLGTLVTEDMLQATKKADSGTVEFTLPYGYYYITSTLGDYDLQNGVSKSAVTIDSTTPNALVIDKNQGPSWFDAEEDEDKPESGDPPFVKLGKYILEDGKKVKVNSVNYGDTVKFETSFGATNYVGEKQVQTYFIHDTIDPGFNGITNLVVKVYDAALASNPKTLTLNSDYKVIWADDNHDFSVSIPWDDADGKPLYSANAVIDLTYQAVLNDTAVLAGTGNLNTTYFDYRMSTDIPADSSNPDKVPATPYHESSKKTTTTYTFALGITKVDGSQVKTLKGAQFSVKQGETVIKATKTADGVYKYDPTNGTAAFDTDTNGILIIKGLKGTAAGTTYTVKEEKAPNGYNILLTDKTVTLDLDNTATYTKKAYAYYDAKNKITDTVTENALTVSYSENVAPLFIANERGLELPVTGGMGTTVFYVVGGILAFGALVLLIAKKRMKSK